MKSKLPALQPPPLKPHGKTTHRVAYLFFLALLLVFSQPQVNIATLNLSSNSRAYLPLLITPETIKTRARPIWYSGAAAPNPYHQVVLFRKTFSLATAVQNADLQIFADTRYEAWVDGVWIGRGPARFSRTLHEYDNISLGTLNPGNHNISVLVQFAPNFRRSESQTPHLLAHIQGVQNGEAKIIVATNNQWKARFSDAWNYDAIAVHTLGLIGPTEIVDLSKLPRNWNQLNFDDQYWDSAIIMPSTSAQVHQRTIPALSTNKIVPAQNSGVVDVGTISPQRQMIEVPYNGSDKQSLQINMKESGVVNIDMLGNGDTPNTANINGIPLNWQSLGSARPDAYSASVYLEAGVHSLNLEQISRFGTTVAVSKNATVQTPLQQNAHAGRRLLLGNVQPNAIIKAVVVPNTGVNIEMPASAMPGYVVLDFGRTRLGRIMANVTTTSNTIIDIGWDERLAAQKRPLPFPGPLHPEWNQTDSWMINNDTRAITTIDARAGRYLLIAAWGKGSVTINNLYIEEQLYPTSPIGSFNSSDTKLNRIWQVGATTAMVNMQDAYADPWRERGQWWGDAFIVDHVNRVSFGDYALLRRGLLMLADSITSDGRKFSMAPNNGDNNIIDYGMLWVQSLANYLRLTEDRGLAQLVYAKVDAFLNYLESLENKQTGLLNIPVEHWSKSALIDWYAYYSLPKSSTAGQSASVNAMYYGTIVDASTISAFAGDVSGAGSYSRRAENLKRSINNTLFNNTEKRYISTFVQDTVVPPSLHAQAWTLAYDVPTSENVNAVAVELMRNVYLENSVENPAPEKFEIYGTYWILEALAKSKRYNDAVRLINNYYYPMIERWGATTWWESFDINRGVSYIQSLSHGWGSSPTWFLTTRIAGVRQVSPTRWEARPPFSGVKFAEATIPLGPNKLPLSFRWDEDSCLKHKIQINAPNTFSGKVVLPYGTNNGLNGLVIIIDGKIAWANNTPLNSQITRESDGMHIPITPGNHIIDITRTTCTN